MEVTAIFREDGDSPPKSREDGVSWATIGIAGVGVRREGAGVKVEGTVPRDGRAYALYLISCCWRAAERREGKRGRGRGREGEAEGGMGGAGRKMEEGEGGREREEGGGEKGREGREGWEVQGGR